MRILVQQTLRYHVASALTKERVKLLSPVSTTPSVPVQPSPHSSVCVNVDILVQTVLGSTIVLPILVDAKGTATLYAVTCSTVMPATAGKAIGGYGATSTLTSVQWKNHVLMGLLALIPSALIAASARTGSRVHSALKFMLRARTIPARMVVAATPVQPQFPRLLRVCFGIFGKSLPGQCRRLCQPCMSEWRNLPRSSQWIYLRLCQIVWRKVLRRRYWI